MKNFMLFILLVLIFSDAWASSFRCGRTLVKLGESTNTLIKKCGQPVRKYSGREVVNNHGRLSRVGVSNWVFERRGKKDMIVSVSGGAIIKIQRD